MKLALFIIASALSLATLVPNVALADSYTTTESTSPSGMSSETTTVQSEPSTTVIKESPVYVAPSETQTTIVDKRKKHHLISAPFVKVL
jgi:hypothetical protein